METTDIDSLISHLQKVKGAMVHPEFEAAYQDLVDTNDDVPDASDLTVLVWFLDDQNLWIWEENGKLYSQGASDAFVWKDGEWVDTAMLDENDE